MQFAHWLLCGPLGALAQMSYFHALLPAQSDSQAGSRPINGRHLLCSQMFPILSPSAPQGGLLLLILVQMGVNFYGWKHSKAKVWFSMFFLPLCFKIYCVNKRVDAPREGNNCHWKGSFPEKKAHGGWWRVGRGSHTGSTRERKELWARHFYGGFCRKECARLERQASGWLAGMISADSKA